MQKSFIFSCIALIALFFTNSDVFAKKPSEESAIRKCIQKNLEASQNEDAEAYWETCKPATEQSRAQTEAALEMVFEIYDLSYKLESFKLLKLEGNQAEVEVVTVLKKIRGPEFRDNRTTYQHILKKINGRWYIVKSIPVKSEALKWNERQAQYFAKALDEIAVRKCIETYFSGWDRYDEVVVCSIVIFEKDPDRLTLINFFRNQKQNGFVPNRRTVVLSVSRDSQRLFQISRGAAEARRIRDMS